MKKNRKPTHPAAKELKKLFKGIKKWSSLKNRISKLKTSKLKGDAFEVFAEAFLVAVKKSPEVIPAPCFTSKIREKYHFPSKMPDAGADGIYLAPDGRMTAYQAKFRSNQKNLIWEELGTFFGVAEYVPSRCVITNCQSVVKTVGEMKNHDGRYFTFREKDLDDLTEKDFAKIENWVNQEEGRTVKEFTLREDQLESIKKINKELDKTNRTQSIRACGTGKTVVGAYAAKERADVKNLVFFCPSLALMRQAYLEYMEHYYEPHMRMVAVCSDEKITDYEIHYDASEVGFPATTDPKTLKKLLKDSEYNVIFCTYQSSEVLHKAGIKFQLGIFDEAHRTATHRSSSFARPLFDRFIKIDKRLFMTATPRNRRSKNPVTSMDDESIYGTRSDVLTFSEAKDLGIICDFKIVISVITSEELDRDSLLTGSVASNGVEVRAIQRAHQDALKKAIKKFKIKKVFSFHSRCYAAESFTSRGEEGIGSIFKGLETYYVDGKMSAGEREQALKDFENSKLGLVSNAKCLNEGVNVPAVDCVAFIQPRKGPEDITQAVGRCMRTHPGKEIGYLFVPIYVEVQEGETEDEALRRTKYDQIVAVAEALREHSDEFENLLEVLGQERGRGIVRGAAQTAFEQVFEFSGTSVSMRAIQRAIAAQISERMVDGWDVRYGELEEFYEKNGHSVVPQKYKNQHGTLGQGHLGQWVCDQRERYNYTIGDKNRRTKRKNLLAGLTQGQIDKLNKLDFVWSVDLAKWDTAYDQTVDFIKSGGDVNDTEQTKKVIIDLDKFTFEHSQCKGKPKTLKSWIADQRRYRKGAVGRGAKNSGRWHFQKNDPRLEKLNKLGIEWDVDNAAIARRHLDIIKKAGGVSGFPTKRGGTTGRWLSSQRQKEKQGHQSKHFLRIKKELDKYSDMWWGTQKDKEWLETFNELKEFKKTHGRWPTASGKRVWISLRLANQAARLAYWMHAQRKKKGDQVAEGTFRRKKLLSIDFPFKPNKHDTAFWHNFELLKIFKTKNRHTNVPGHLKKSSNNPSGSFVTSMRMKKRRGKLGQDKIKALDSLGFDWEPRPVPGTIVQLHIEERNVNYNRKLKSGKTVKEQYTNYRIPVRKTWASPVSVVSYKSLKKAKKALKLLQQEIDKGGARKLGGCKMSAEQLRDWIYTKVPKDRIFRKRDGTVPKLKIRSEESAKKTIGIRHKIYLRKKYGPKHAKAVVVDYSTLSGARKALKLLQEKINNNCKESAKELREWVYEEVPRPGRWAKK